MTYSAEVLADSPLCYLRLGESSGTTAADASGNGHTGTYVGTPTLGVTGLLYGDANTAVTLNGSTQYVQIANSGWANLSTYTVEMWFKTTASSGMLCSQYDGSGSSLRIWQLALNADGSLGFATFSSNVGTGYNTARTGLNDGNPHHVVVTVTGNTIKIYIDGVLEFSTTTAVARDTSSGAKLYVGQRNAASPIRLAGTVDEFALYSTVLSSTRVTAHNTAGVAPPNPAVSQDYLELVTASSAPDRAISQAYLEVLSVVYPPITDITVDAPSALGLNVVVPPADVTVDALAGLTVHYPARNLDEVYVEAEAVADAAAKLTEVYVEAESEQAALARLAQVYVEVWGKVPAATWRGWGIPI